MNKTLGICLAAAAVFAMPLTAQAWCSKPSTGFGEPTPPLFKPSKPYCVNTKTCSSWDISNYQRELEQYVEGLKIYVQQAQDFANNYAEGALKYAKCEIDNLD